MLRLDFNPYYALRWLCNKFHYGHTCSY